ncbi:cytosol aminopeptidase-like [Rhodnius prolixus]
MKLLQSSLAAIFSRRKVDHLQSEMGSFNHKLGWVQQKRYASLLPEESFNMSCSLGSSVPMGLVLGVYCDDEDKNADKMRFTDSGTKYNNYVKGKLQDYLKMALPLPKLGQVRLLYGMDSKFNAIAAVGMGTDCIGYNPVEEIDEQKEVIRIVSAAGVKALQNLSFPRIYVESFGHAESSAEGSNMGIWLYQENRAERNKKVIPKIEIFDSNDWIGWQIGHQKAMAQNLARNFMEMPANVLTPSAFALQAVDVLTKAGVNVEVKVRNWAKLRDFNSFLSVSSGSSQAPIFLEAFYEGCETDVAPVVLVGKGITFDAGGICLKSCKQMKYMRGDMSGAAAVVSAIRAISNLQIPVNVRALIPLCENMPGAGAYKPGDIVKAKNGKTIMVQTTAHEGRLILADALSYCIMFNPKFIVDLGTLTREIAEVMGSSAAGVFTNSDSLYDMMRIASIHTGDRVWRFPLWDYYSDDVRNSEQSDVLNVGSDEDYGGACNAAAFLREFVPPCVDWMHIDSYGIALASGKTQPYLRKGMSGRPTRTLIEFLSQLACRHGTT